MIVTKRKEYQKTLLMMGIHEDGNLLCRSLWIFDQNSQLAKLFGSKETIDHGYPILIHAHIGFVWKLWENSQLNIDIFGYQVCPCVIHFETNFYVNKHMPNMTQSINKYIYHMYVIYLLHYVFMTDSDISHR